MKKYVILFIFNLIMCSCLNAQTQFHIQPTNGPYGGYIRSFCSDTNTKDLFINADHIYKLNNTTNEWEKQFTELDTLEYYNFDIIYSDRIYFLKYVLGHDDQVWGGGLFRSTDKGKSWKEVDDRYLDFQDIISTKSKYIFGTGGLWETIHRSSDYGETWEECINGIDSAALADGFSQVEKITVGDTDYIFLRGWENGIYRSTNYGDSWEKISDSLPKSQYSTLTNYTAMTTTTDNKLFVASDAGIFRSTDFGESWFKLTDGIQSLSSYGMYFMNSDSYGNVFTGGYSRGLYLLKQNDTTWKSINIGLVPISTNDFFIDETQNGFYAATNCGVYKTTNNGDNWFFYNEGIKIPIEVKCLATIKDGGVFAGTERNGIYYSSDKGNKWVTANNGISDSEIFYINVDSKGNVYAGTYNSHLYKSSNNGSSWDTLNIGELKKYTEIEDIAINSKDYLIVPVSYSHVNSPMYNKLIISKDGGLTWDSIGFNNKYIYRVTVDKNDNIFIPVDSSIYKSTDDGNSWYEVFKYEKSLNASCFLVTNDNSIFLGTRYNRIFRSTDGGESWVHLTKDLDSNIRVSTLESPDIENRIICGTLYDGYYISFDNGDNWTNYKFRGITGDVPLQIAPQEFNYFAYDGNGTMYAATYNGVYKWEDITSIQDLNDKTNNFEIYPNPSSGIINLDFNNNSPDIYDIEITNLYGQTVKKLYSGRIEEGKFKLNWDGSDSASNQVYSGIYFISIKNREYNQTEKFLIIK